MQDSLNTERRYVRGLYDESSDGSQVLLDEGFYYGSESYVRSKKMIWEYYLIYGGQVLGQVD